MSNQISSQKVCVVCGKVFIKAVTCSKKNWAKRTGCSRSCAKVGQESWLKGKKRPYDSPGSFKKGMTPWNKGKERPEILSEQNHKWKGDDASLVAKHTWVVRRLGKPQKCEHCGTTEKRMYHWSNISGEYRRDVSDYQRLCVPCHKKYDLERLAVTS